MAEPNGEGMRVNRDQVLVRVRVVDDRGNGWLLVQADPEGEHVLLHPPDPSRGAASDFSYGMVPAALLVEVAEDRARRLCELEALRLAAVELAISYHEMAAQFTAVGVPDELFRRVDAACGRVEELCGAASADASSETASRSAEG